MNQYLVANGGHALGDINPLLYRVASGRELPGFRDVTLGGNAVDVAIPGYDLVTGLGSPNVEATRPRLPRHPEGHRTSMTTMTCRVCGVTVPAGEFCGNCGATESHRRGDGPAWLRLSAYAAAPTEHVLSPRITSTIFPSLPRRSRTAFGVALDRGDRVDAGQCPAAVAGGAHRTARLRAATAVRGLPQGDRRIRRSVGRHPGDHGGARHRVRRRVGRSRRMSPSHAPTTTRSACRSAPPESSSPASPSRWRS